jgi:branched-subunit amino acid transport protein
VSWTLIAILAAITYASRAGALVLLPSLPPRVRTILDRMPPLLFAGLAAHSLLVPGAGLVEAPILAAAAGAALVSPLRSFPVCLVAGVVAYFAWGVIS